MRLLPACERRRLGDRERGHVLATHHAHHRQRRLRLWGRAARTALGPAATAGAATGASSATTTRGRRRRALDVRAAGPATARPELAVDADEARGLEARRGREYVEPERRLDHELLRVRAAQYRLGRVDAHVQHGPNPLGRDGEELAPGAAPAAEEEGGDDEEARHRLAFGVTSSGGRTQILADALVDPARVCVRLVVQGERVAVGLLRGRWSLSEGLLV